MRVRKFVLPLITALLVLSNLYSAYKVLDLSIWMDDMANYQRQLEQRSDVSLLLFNDLRDHMTASMISDVASRAEAKGNVVKREDGAVEIEDYRFEIRGGRVTEVSIPYGIIQ